MPLKDPADYNLKDINDRLIEMDVRLMQIRDDARRPHWLGTFMGVLLALFVWSLAAGLYARWTMQRVSDSINSR